MSLRSEPIGPVPEETARVARAAFPRGTHWMRLRDELGVIYDDASFRPLFAVRGRPAGAPWRLALVSVMQFAERLSDRKAADAVRGRIDGKYALGLPLADAGFDASVLCEFRARLLASSQELLLLEILLDLCRKRGWLAARGRQRTDSTHVLAAIHGRNRAETVRETMRHALDVLAESAPAWLLTHIQADWAERYRRGWDDDRLPSKQAERDARVAQVGADGLVLLTALYAEAFIKTPRQVVRWINTLSVTYPVIASEVNAVDFVAVEGMRVFLPELYDLVRQNIDAFTSPPAEILGMNQATHKQFHEAWLQRIPDGARGAARSLLSHLFPYVGTSLAESSLVGDESAWRRDLRVCSRPVFPTYFRLAAPEGVVTNAEFQALLATTNDPVLFGQSLVRLASEVLPDGRSRVRDVLERLVDYADEGLADEVRPAILNALADVGSSLIIQSDTPGGLFEFDNVTLIGRIIYRLLRPFDQETRFRLLYDAFSKGGAIGLIVREISILGQEHGKHTSSLDVATSENERIVSAAQLSQLEELGLKRIREAVDGGWNVLDDPLAGAILHRWREWGGPEEVDSWVTRVIATDDGMIQFLERSLMDGWSSREGRTYNIDFDSIKVFVNPDTLVARARALVGKEGPTTRQSKALQAFLKTLV